jgi:hypothetical protein
MGEQVAQLLVDLDHGVVDRLGRFGKVVELFEQLVTTHVPFAREVANDTREAIVPDKVGDRLAEFLSLIEFLPNHAHVGLERFETRQVNVQVCHVSPFGSQSQRPKPLDDHVPCRCTPR